MQNTLAIASAGKQRPTSVFTQNIAIGQAELADRPLDHGGQPLRCRAEELLAAIDQIITRIGVTERTL